MSRRFFSTALFSLFVAVPTAVAAQSVVEAPERDRSERGLDAGLRAIRPDQIRSDLYFFADDEMRGRDTPSHELRVAARFIRARLDRLRFTPGGTDGSWFHTFDLTARRIDVERSKAVAIGERTRTQFVFGEDYFLYSLKHVANLSHSADVVYCGAGEKRELASIEFDGRWALCVDRGGSSMRRMRNVERAGAGGLLVIPDPDSKDDPYVGKLARTTESALSGVVSRSSGDREPPMPSVYFSRDAALRLLEATTIRVEQPETTWPAIGAPVGIEFIEQRAGGGIVDVENVCGLWPGSDSLLRDEVIIVSAHYDHVGARGGKIWNGADDNGSGSMGLLALAEALHAYGPMRRTVLLLWVSGKEKGLWGSDAWTKDPSLPEGARPICDINIDMVGRNAPEYMLVTPSPQHAAYNGLSRLVHELAPGEGFTQLGSADPWWARSDHANFARNLDIPVAFLFSDEHEDYHQPTDTADKIDYDKIHRVIRLVLRLIDALQSDDLDLR